VGHFISAVAISILSAALCAAAQDEPPANIVRLVAEREAATEAVRSQYLYRQTVSIEELDSRGMSNGFYREVREVIFTPQGARLEQAVGQPVSRLTRLKLTDEDFADIRNIQPLLLTPENLPRYQIRFRGEERVDGRECWVLQITPRQILQGMRLFDGTAWVDKPTLAIVRTYGQAVPPIYSEGSENLFPRFTTLRQPIDGEHWFPVRTYANDTLPFKNGPLRIRFTIDYTGYRKFESESKITFEPDKKP
jgi:hypothetical protein